MHVTLPDGTQLELPEGATGLDAANAIGSRLAAATAAVLVDGELRDLRLPLPDGAALRIVRVGDPEALPVLRHSAAHVLAEAARHLHPGVKVTIGPPIENGFYYDFEFPEPVGEDDLAAIEAEMRRILKTRHPFVRTVVSREEARARFEAEGEPYKVELIDDLPEGETITLYQQDDFVDLCRGPHLQDTGPIKAFKLTTLAGAYWRGDAKRQMLTRVYGTAFFDQAALDAHVHQIEEARRRDHRRIGRELDLFSFHEEAPGAAFWHPNGLSLWASLADMWRIENRRRGYSEIKTPIVFSNELFRTSGHWDKFPNMYKLEIDEREFALKPMNCPAHCLVFGTERRSYRELPLRFNEMGLVHRHEPSGTLHGLMRVREFTQDDAHLFCTMDQVEEEVAGVLAFMTWIYDLFGLGYKVELSTRPEVRVGADDVWDRAEAALASVLAKLGMEYQLNPGDGAFYGPKIDFHLVDSIGRTWQCGTCQLDFNLPERFQLSYIGPDDREHRPVMIHRAMLGSFERFIGILIEHYAGDFPLWLAPQQVAVLPIADRHADYARVVVAALQDAGLRASADLRGESVGRKIAEAEARKVPAMLVVGDREAESVAVGLRRHGRGDLGARPLSDVVLELVAEDSARTSND